MDSMKLGCLVMDQIWMPRLLETVFELFFLHCNEYHSPSLREEISKVIGPLIEVCLITKIIFKEDLFAFEIYTIIILDKLSHLNSALLLKLLKETGPRATALMALSFAIKYLSDYERTPADFNHLLALLLNRNLQWINRTEVKLLRALNWDLSCSKETYEAYRDFYAAQSNSRPPRDRP